ncbi:MAG TPA: helix-turn-helix domain-containing protein [Acidimicrobiales bacterium]
MARPAPGADRSVAILELLAAHPGDRFTLSEVARRCSLNKATAHALLAALSQRGILLRHPDEKRYSLGPRLVAIGEAAQRGYTAIDFAPAVLDRLSAATGRWSRAFARRDDRVTVVAQARVPADVDPLDPVMLPFIPPLGAVWMAWSDRPSVEAWLARAATAEAVAPSEAALPAIRHDGYAVTRASPELRLISRPVLPTGSSPTGATAGGQRRPTPDEVRALLAAIGRQHLLLIDFDAAGAYRIADIGAPVFGASGAAELVVALSGLDDVELSGAEIRALGARVAATAEALTAAVLGRRPQRPATGTT